MKLRVHAEAEAELCLSALYYEDRRVGLGQDFFSCVSDCMASILRAPMRFARYEGLPLIHEFRRAIVDRFPYVVVFKLLDEDVLVVAVAHARRRPGYWIDRRD